MSTQRQAKVLGVAVTPVSFLAGVVFAFLGCCLAGRLLSQRNPFKWFTRFHRYISPETRCYPTASQVRALARERLDANKVAVIVGGNSILNGQGQRVEHLWTRRLQQLLGKDYCVLNLAVSRAEPGEFGAVVAEALAAEYPRMIYLTAFGSEKAPAASEGSLYRYFYYDALYKGMLPSRAEQDTRGEERAETKGDQAIELLRGRRMDRLLFFQDFWTTCTLKWINTTWSPLLVAGQTAPHLVYADVRGQDETPYPASEGETARHSVRTRAGNLGERVFGHWPLGPREGLRPVPETSPLVRDFEACFPAPTRQRTLILAVHDSPLYVNELEPAAKAEYRWVHARAAEVLEAGGFGALDVGSDFTIADYFDQVHLSESGGDKLAKRVALKVRAMARQLGYRD